MLCHPNETNLNELVPLTQESTHEAHTRRVHGLLFVDPSKGSGVVSPSLRHTGVLSQSPKTDATGCQFADAMEVSPVAVPSK